MRPRGSNEEEGRKNSARKPRGSIAYSRGSGARHDLVRGRNENNGRCLAKEMQLLNSFGGDRGGAKIGFVECLRTNKFKESGERISRGALHFCDATFALAHELEQIDGESAEQKGKSV